MKEAHSPSTKPKRRAYLTTGATSGIGAAMVERLMQDDDGALVINLGRSSHDQVLQTLGKEHEPETLQQEFPHTVAGERIQYRQVDFNEVESLDAELQAVIHYVKENSLEIAGIIHCAGVAVVHNQNQPEEEKQPQIDLMYRVNRDAAINIGRTVKDSGVLGEHAKFGYVASLAAYKDKPSVPGLEQYADTKRQAEAELKALFGEDYFTIYPGTYKTPMVDGFIKDLKTALEFFEIKAGRAIPEDALMVETSNVMRGASETKDVVYPLIPSLYVKMINTDRRDFFLPFFIKLFAKGILRSLGQGQREHDERIAYHKKNKSYGENFPYDDVTYDKLYPEVVGNALGKLGQFLNWL